MTFKLSDFDYALPAELIAQEPLARRDESRLMVLSRNTGRIAHHRFLELGDLLRSGDLLVLNDTQVIPAKFACLRKTGGKIDGLFLREEQIGVWEVLLRGGGKCRDAEQLTMVGAEDVSVRLVENSGEGKWRVKVTPAADAVSILHRAGTTPLPPYIHREDQTAASADRQRYQTVYAARPGAVAAPTAGLHFTEETFDRLKERQIETARVTLHVSMGTFAPVKSEDLAAHQMHSEWFELSLSAAEQILAARDAGRRIVAVGTTSLRVLEAACRLSPDRRPQAASGWTDLFLYPPAEFFATDAIITNFHLPKSTLLMLMAAFCSPGKTDGLEMILKAYEQARLERYRFFSYGDAMLIE